MAKERPQKTLADYVAIAISPALLMLLIGSLAWFLLEVTYDDRYASRIRWVLFWFVFGSVLVGRIAIEQGREYARIYWVLIGLAGAAVVFRLLDTYQFGALALLGLIMWCANKLTWDCTLIDDSQDASGEGLLQVSGFDENADQQATAADGSGDRRQLAVPDEPPPAEGPAAVPLWKRLFLNRSERENRPHAPGLWVVYFSLAALPLFGVGQLMIPVEETESRDWGFKLLVVYVAAALGLLLTTSFLGLRRYLRQRRLKMPVRMTAAWLVTGTAMVVALLAACLLLPRPGSATSITNVIDQVASKARDASKIAFLNDDAGENQGQPTGRSPADQDPEKQQADSGGRSGRGGTQAGQSDDDRKPAERDGQSDSQGQKSGAGQAQGNNDSGSSSDNSRQADQQQQAGQQQQGSQQQQSGQQQDSRQQGGGQQQQSSNRESGQSRERQQQGRSDQARNERTERQDEQRRDETERQQRSGGGGGSQQQEQSRRGQSQQQQQQGAAGSSTPSESSQQNNTTESETSAAQAPQAADWIGRLVKLVLYLILIAAALYLIIRHWQTIVATLARMWSELRDMFASLFGARRTSTARAGAAADDLLAPAPPRPFASFDDPFLTGAAGRMSPEQLVIYTFRALEAWGFDQNHQRTADQTPLEYAAELGRHFPQIAEASRTAARLLTRVAYAEHAPTDRCREMLEPVWSRLTETARRPAMATG